MASSAVKVTAEFSDPELAQTPMCMADIAHATGADPAVLGRLFDRYGAPQTAVGLAIVLTKGVAETLRDALRATAERNAVGALIVSHGEAVDDTQRELDRLFGPVQEVEEEEA
jgi:hypothetical protein